MGSDADVPHTNSQPPFQVDNESGHEPAGHGGMSTVAGFVLAISAKWPSPEAAYRKWASLPTSSLESDKGAAKTGIDTDEFGAPGVVASGPFALGETQFVVIPGSGPELSVANMVAQHNTRKAPDGTPPIRYDALRKCLELVGYVAEAEGATVHMPRIGAGLAGGDWKTIEQIVIDEICGRGVDVTVYDLAVGKRR